MKVRAILRFKHETFYQARIAAGLTQTELARQLGVQPGTVNNWENFRGYPSAGSELAGALERVLRTPYEALFPPEYIEAVAQKRGLPIFAVSEVRLLPSGPDLLLPSPEDLLIESDTKQKLNELLKTELSDRQYEVVCRRFGFGNHDEQTLEQIGDYMQLSKERIRQLEGLALGKIRKTLTRRGNEWLAK